MRFLTIWILSILGKIAGSWASIVGAIFVALGVAVQIFQWLLPLSSKESVSILSTSTQEDIGEDTSHRIGKNLLPTLSSARALGILEQAHSGNYPNTWRVFKTIPPWLVAGFAAIICFFIGDCVWFLAGFGFAFLLIIGGLIALAITTGFMTKFGEDEALFDRLIFRYILVLTPEGFVTSGPSAIAIDYGAITNIKCHMVRNNRRLIWKDTAKLFIEQPGSEGKIEVRIDGRFGPPQIIAQEIVLAYQQFKATKQEQHTKGTRTKKSPSTP